MMENPDFSNPIVGSNVFQQLRHLVTSVVLLWPHIFVEWVSSGRAQRSFQSFRDGLDVTPDISPAVTPEETNQDPEGWSTVSILDHYDRF